MHDNTSARYSQLLDLSKEILVAASGEEWDKLIDLEQRRAELVGQLQQCGAPLPDSEEDRQKLIRLIEAIQACDEKTRPMILDWMEELRALFGSVSNERKLDKHYGGF